MARDYNAGPDYVIDVKKGKQSYDVTERYAKQVSYLCNYLTKNRISF
jgi:hypothetical protein